jgi:hypothetical protein
MIKRFLITISMLMFLKISLISRENPFEPTKTYLEEKKELKLALEKENNKTKAIKSIMKQEIVSKKPTMTKQEIVSKPVTISTIKQITIKLMEEIIVQKQKKTKIYKYHLLPFVDIHITNNIMSISTKYKLKKFFLLEEENKLVFDYVGKNRFYTKREILSSHKDFNKVIIGAHPEDYYFRVVIQTKEKVEKYKVEINKEKDKTITIQKKIK